MANRGAGQLYEHVAFDMRANVDDGHGNYRSDFVEQFTCRAGFTFLRGGEAVIAGRLEGRQPIVVRVRSSSQSRLIRPDWRMRNVRDGSWKGPSNEQYWDGPIYAVRTIAPTADRMWLDIMVESSVAA